MEKERLIEFWGYKFRFKPEVLEAFKKVKREDFVLSRFKKDAYKDTAIPYLMGQTVSQPSTVMIMTNELNIKPGNKILEIGTGSGYHTAILSKLVGPKGKIYTFDIHQEIIKQAKKNLKNYKNVKVYCKDASGGYKKAAPYDRILVTAGARNLPEKLLNQLQGIMIIPIGLYYQQKLMKITKTSKRVKKEILGNFAFVPLKGKY